MSAHVSGAAQDGPTSGPSRFELEFAGLGRSIDDVLLAAAGSVFWLVLSCGERGFPPFDAHLEDAIKRFGSPPQAPLDLWRQCVALDRLARRWIGRGLEVPAYADVAAQVRRARDASEAATRAEAAPVPDAPVEDTVGPDEAVGRPPESGNGADDQLSLGAR